MKFANEISSIKLNLEKNVNFDCKIAKNLQRLKLCDTIKEVDGAKTRFLALSFGVIKNKSITTPSMVFGVKEVGIGAAHKTQKVAKLAPVGIKLNWDVNCRL